MINDRSLFLDSGAEVSDDGRYIVLSIRQGCDPVNRLYYCDLESIDNKITGMLIITEARFILHANASCGAKLLASQF